MKKSLNTIMSQLLSYSAELFNNVFSESNTKALFAFTVISLISIISFVRTSSNTYYKEIKEAEYELIKLDIKKTEIDKKHYDKCNEYWNEDKKYWKNEYKLVRYFAEEGFYYLCILLMLTIIRLSIIYSQKSKLKKQKIGFGPQK